MKFYISFLTCFAFFANAANALSNTDPKSYYLAKKGIANGDDISSYSQFVNHPLHPNLAAQYYRKNLHEDDKIISLLSSSNKATALKRLHNAWIVEKYNQGQYDMVVQHYFSTGNQKAECAYRSSLLSIGNTEKAFANIYETWMSPQSISSLCDSVFAQWQGASDVNNRLKRAKLAYLKGNGSFALKIVDDVPLGNPDRETIIRFANFIKSPRSLVTESPESLTSSKLARELLPKALSELIRKDSVQYAQFAMQFSSTLGDNKDYQEMLGKLTQYLANRGDSQASQSYRLIIQPSQENVQALLRYLISSRDFQSLTSLISPNNDNDMALYWLGRAMEQQNKDPSSVYAKAAKKRSYYGFLSADKIGQPYRFNAKPIRADKIVQNEFSNNSILQQALLMAEYGEDIDARKEILAFAKGMDKNRKIQFAFWLNNNGFYFEAIYFLGKLKEWDDIYTRFPTPFNLAVSVGSQETGIDSTWIYAILRQESSMNPRAISSAKAKGLMQLIPSTAQLMANHQGISLANEAIFDAHTNVRLGSGYLGKMFNRYGNIAMASAAYNAGPGRVDKWKQANTHDMAMWVELIPFNETRKYVKNILEYQQVYAMHLGVTIPPITKNLSK